MLKRQSDPIGGIDLVNSLLGFSVFFYNLIDQIVKGQDIISRAHYTLPYLMIAIIVLVYRTIYVKTILYLLTACIITAFADSLSDFSGAIFFIFAFHQYRKNWYGVVLVAVTLACMTLRSVLTDDTIIGNILMLSIYMFVYAIYYFTIYSKEKKGNIEGLTKKESRLLDLLAEGKIQKEIAGIMGVSKYDVWNMVKKIKEKTGYISMDQIMFNYGNMQKTENSK